MVSLSMAGRLELDDLYGPLQPKPLYDSMKMESSHRHSVMYWQQSSMSSFSHEFYIHELVFKLRVKMVSSFFEKLHYWQIPEACPIV